jgi:hypothetical protein
LNKSDGAALANHLALRDILRRNHGLREEYGQLKLVLAKEEHADIGAYGAKKQAFIVRALEQSGLSKQELDRIMTRPHRRVDAMILLDLKRNYGI